MVSEAANHRQAISIAAAHGWIAKFSRFHLGMAARGITRDFAGDSTLDLCADRRNRARRGSCAADHAVRSRYAIPNIPIALAKFAARRCNMTQKGAFLGPYEKRTPMSESLHSKVLIIGAGPARLYRSHLRARANLAPIQVMGLQPGGS